MPWSYLTIEKVGVGVTIQQVLTPEKRQHCSDCVRQGRNWHLFYSNSEQKGQFLTSVITAPKPTQSMKMQLEPWCFLSFTGGNRPAEHCQSTFCPCPSTASNFHPPRKHALLTCGAIGRKQQEYPPALYTFHKSPCWQVRRTGSSGQQSGLAMTSTKIPFWYD